MKTKTKKVTNGQDKCALISFALVSLILLSFNVDLYSQVQWNNTIITGTYSSAIGSQTESTGNYSFSAGLLTKAYGISSISLGNKSVADGHYSMSLGESCFSGSQSYSIGQNAKAKGQQSFAIGRFVETATSSLNSFIIGTGSSQFIMQNNISNSLMIGFNSSVPTFFIGPSSGTGEGIGMVGIGTTAPQANMHIKSLINDNAVLFIETGSWNSSKNAVLNMGNIMHGITSNMNSGLTFRTQKYYIFDQGNVGIGTTTPVALLHVDKGNTLLNGNLQVGNRESEVITALYAKLGIGTDMPLESLHVDKGNTLLNGNLQVGNRERSTITTIYGKVGIKTNNPLADLQIDGAVSIGYNTHTPPGSKGLIVNGPVGIGTFSPSCQLEVAGKIKTTELQLTTGYMKDYILQSDENGNAQWVNPVNVNTGIWIQNGNNVTVDNTKKVGIGTATPAEALDLKGNMLCSGNIKGGRTDWQSFGIYANSSETDGSYILLGNNSTQAGSIKLYSTGTSGRIEFHNQNMQVMSIRADNNVYFGNPDEATNIFVNGEITSSLVRVNAQSWWDCVFEDNYQLMPLADVEAYIQKNRHLPDLPSEAEIKASGIDVAQMNALLLKKIEELTLYVIELEKKIQK